MGILEKISKKGDKPEEAVDKKVEKKASDDKKKPAAKTAKKPAVKKAEKKPAAKKVAAKKSDSDSKKAEAKKEVKGTEKKSSRPEALFAYGIISSPVATEKSELNMMNGKYTFMVKRGANKVEIARAIKELYGVSPVSVRVMNIKGKKVRFGRVYGTRKATRKAIVTLKEGDSISIAE